LRIVNTTRFDDVDHDAGYEYRGFNFVIRNEMDEFHVRTYDGDPGKATVVRPISMYKNCNLRMLVDFLQSELGVASICLFKGEVGSYEEMDSNGLIFNK
jgi:hypothetical protein